MAHLTQDYEVVSLRTRRAWKVLEVTRSVVRYVQRRANDLVLRTRLLELAHERKGFGYRRLHQMLKREGVVMNLKKLRRHYAGERLQVRKRPSRHLLRNCLSGNRRSQKSPWNPLTHGYSARAKPKIVTRLCLRHVLPQTFAHLNGGR